MGGFGEFRWRGLEGGFLGREFLLLFTLGIRDDGGFDHGD
jgi:hypothetical protein